jgi:hypothetical protein
MPLKIMADVKSLSVFVNESTPSQIFISQLKPLAVPGLELQSQMDLFNVTLCLSSHCPP